MPANRPVLIGEDTPVIDTVDLIEATDALPADCDQCGGELTYLGTLGNLTWCRCRDCGAEQSVDVSDLEAA